MKKLRSNATDMTSGSPYRLLFLFTAPLLLGNVFQQLYNMVDSIVVGNFIGEKALAAVNCTPFVRQYDILNNKWGALLCRKEYQTNAIHQNSRSR